MFQRILVFMMFLFFSSSCADANYYYKKYMNMYHSLKGDNAEEEYLKVEGEEPGKYLAKMQEDFTQNSADILKAMQVAENEKGNLNLTRFGLMSFEEADKPQEVDEATAEVLTSSQRAKLAYDSDSYGSEDEFEVKMPPAFWRLADENKDYTKNTVTWKEGKEDQFTITTLDKMPVRDQGQRGTCATFAGIGQIEGYLLKHYGNTLTSGIDLAEQRFYYLSKPQNWDDGGDAAKGGSNSGTGFMMSYGFKYNASKDEYTQNKVSAFNIPLETDCSYNKILGDTDLQTPSVNEGGCLTGVAQVTNMVAWDYNYTHMPETAQDIYNMLVEKDIPVIVATKLSANWENNDGLITLAEAGGTPGLTSHASGHAYLVVGAKKIDETKFPNEGGMCFLIKNSWNKGWGVDGLSCMTLAWFNAWRYSGGFPSVVTVALDGQKYKIAKADLDKLPTDAEEADPDTKQSDKIPKQGSNGKKKGTATVASFRPEDYNSQREGARSGFHLSLEDMTVGALLTDEQEYYRILYKIDGAKFYLRALLAGGKKLTNDLEMNYDNGLLKYFIENRGDVTFGEIDTTKNVITLCSGKYSQVCQLNYQPEWNELLVGLTEAEFRREESAPPYDWKSVDLAGYGIAMSHPSGANSKMDVKFTVNDKETNPLRFNVDLVSGNIDYQGKIIGNYQDLSLCNGDSYRDICRVVVSADKFFVLFKSVKK